MAVLKIKGGRKLYGEVVVQGSKNAVLPILASSILCRDIVKIKRCPKISDVYAMLDLLCEIGCKVHWEDDSVIIDSRVLKSNQITHKQARVMRSSIILVGSMLGREKSVEVSYPGGCSIGARPINLHLDAFRKMNVEITENNDNLCCQTTKLMGAEIDLDFPSVGATENVILAAVLACGTTIIRNAAKEPEITELCEFLRKMGANICGDGTDVIVIEGVECLHGCEFRVVCDRIVLGTYIAAVAGVGGEAFLVADCINQLDEVFELFRAMGVIIQKTDDGIYVLSSGELKAVDWIRTSPYPGFPTDMQSQVMAVLTKANGVSRIYESVFEGRYRTAEELSKMGADIRVEDRMAAIRGVGTLRGANVEAQDLRGGASLVIAGLMAEGVTTIGNIQYIERGYTNIADCYQKLNANISLQKDCIL